MFCGKFLFRILIGLQHKKKKKRLRVGVSGIRQKTFRDILETCSTQLSRFVSPKTSQNLEDASVFWESIRGKSYLYPIVKLLYYKTYYYMVPGNILYHAPEPEWKMLETMSKNPFRDMVLRHGSSGQLSWPIFKG